MSADKARKDWAAVAALADVHEQDLPRNQRATCRAADRLWRHIEGLRARVAELEGAEVVTTREWGVSYGPDDVDEHDTERVAREIAADPSHPGVLVAREIRTGPWREVTS